MNYETVGRSYPRCPHCNREDDKYYYDEWPSEEDVEKECICRYCGKEYVALRRIVSRFDTRKRGSHEYTSRQ